MICLPRKTVVILSVRIFAELNHRVDSLFNLCSQQIVVQFVRNPIRAIDAVLSNCMSLSAVTREGRFRSKSHNMNHISNRLIRVRAGLVLFQVLNQRGDRIGFCLSLRLCMGKASRFRCEIDSIRNELPAIPWRINPYPIKRRQKQVGASRCERNVCPTRKIRDLGRRGNYTNAIGATVVMLAANGNHDD